MPQNRSGFSCRARVQQPAVGGDDVGADHVVERQAVASRQAAEAGAEREPADAGVRHRAGRRHEPERHRLVVEFAEQAAAGDVRRARLRVDVHATHARQVDLHAALAGRLAGVAVAAALHGEQQVVLRARKLTAVRTSAAPVGCTTSAGWRSIDAFSTRRASS